MRAEGIAFLALNLDGLVLVFASQDPEVQQLDARWAACMDRAGVGSYATPYDAQGAAGRRYADGATDAPRLERELAAADARCQADLDYRARRLAVEDRYLAGLAEQFPQVVQRMESILRAAAERAQDVLDG